MPQPTLDDSVAVVTGASSGIGAATARTLAGAGARVVLAARSEDDLRRLAADIEQAGGSARASPTDVTDASQVADLIDETLDAYGRLDLLVNNAGFIDVDPVEEADMGAWETMVDVNLTGLMDVTHEALPALESGDGGHVVNVSSVSDRETSEEYGGYTATKHGVRGFTKSLREETSETVRVTLVSPGLVDTALPERAADLRERMDAVTPLQPEDVAEAIRYVVTQPSHVSVNQLVLRPSDQEK